MCGPLSSSPHHVLRAPQEPWTWPSASGTLLPETPASHCPPRPDPLAAASDGAWRLR